jgi:hypothetical protein
MKTLICLLFVINCLNSYGQMTDTLSPEKKVRRGIDLIKSKKTDLSHQNAVGNVLDDLTTMAAARIPFLSMNQFRQGKADTATVVQINQGGQSGTFIYDSNDVTSPDDTAMVLIRSSKRYKRTFEGFVRPEWFGVTVKTSFLDETVYMMKAIKFLKNHGGGILRLSAKIYTCNLVWHGNDNISIQGLTPSKSVIFSAQPNQFAIKIESGYPENGCFFRDVSISGINNDRHGLYINCGSSYQFDNCFFESSGIGLLSNGTIDNSFIRCTFRNNNVGCVIGTYNSGQTTIKNIFEKPELKTKIVNVTPAFTDTQPSEQTFISCQFYANHCHLVVDYPEGKFKKNANIKFFGGAMQAARVGIYIAQPITFGEYPLIINGVWIENSQMDRTPVLFNGNTMPVCDFYLNGGMISLDNTGVNEMYIVDNTMVNLKNCSIFSNKIHVSGTGSISGENIAGDGIFLPHYIKTGINQVGNRAFGFYTKHKTNLSTAYGASKKYSETHGINSTTGNGWKSLVTKINGGIFDGICWNVICANNDGLMTPPLSVVKGKIYLSLTTIKTDGPSFLMALNQTGGTGNFINLSGIVVDNKWKTIATIGRALNTGKDHAMLNNISGSSKTFQISGWQILEFDTIAELYNFLESSDFAI